MVSPHHSPLTSGAAARSVGGTTDAAGSPLERGDGATGGHSVIPVGTGLEQRLAAYPVTAGSG